MHKILRNIIFFNNKLGMNTCFFFILLQPVKMIGKLQIPKFSPVQQLFRKSGRHFIRVVGCLVVCLTGCNAGDSSDGTQALEDAQVIQFFSREVTENTDDTDGKDDTDDTDEKDEKDNKDDTDDTDATDNKDDTDDTVDTYDTADTEST